MHASLNLHCSKTDCLFFDVHIVLTLGDVADRMSSMLTQYCQHCVNCIGTRPHLCAIAVMHIKVEDHNLHMSLHSIMLDVTC